MIYIIWVVVLLLLLSAGILAYENSRLLSSRKRPGPSAPVDSFMYSVIEPTGLEVKEDGDRVPLFQLITINEAAPGTQDQPEAEQTLTLCRVARGKGEMRMKDAEMWMLDRIRHSKSGDGSMEYRIFLDKSSNPDEKDMILNLDNAVKTV